MYALVHAMVSMLAPAIAVAASALQPTAPTQPMPEHAVKVMSVAPTDALDMDYDPPTDGDAPSWDGLGDDNTWHGIRTDGELGERIADLGASLCLSAVNDGTDYEQVLRDLGLYGTGPGQYTYSGDGRILNHLHDGGASVAGRDSGGSWGSVDDFGEGEIPNASLPNARRYIDFTMRKRDDGSSPPGGRSFANCASMPANLYDYFGLPFKEFADVAHNGLKLPKYGGRGEEHSEPFETEHYMWIPCDPDRTFSEQCQPGDVLCNGKVPHYMLYVGNEIAQRHFPGTTGEICEAGARSKAFWGLRDEGCWDPSPDWLICRPKG